MSGYTKFLEPDYVVSATSTAEILHNNDLPVSVMSNESDYNNMGGRVARKERVSIIDDFTNKEVTEEEVRAVSLIVEGVEYELDLTDDSVKALYAALGPFIDGVTPVPPKQSRVAQSAESRERARRVRAWWHAAADVGMKQSNGLPLPQPNDRGRIPKAVLELYNASNGEVPTGTPKKTTRSKK